MASLNDHPTIAARNIYKAYPGVLANSDVSLAINQGEVHALLGENGAGKSTLAHILSGGVQPDSGHIEVNGEVCHFRSPRDAFLMGVGMVAQHFEMVQTRTVTENVLLADSSEPWFWSPKRANRRVSQIAENFGIKIDPTAIIGDLSLGEQQQVEILRALYRGSRVLVLDEPTSVLTPQQSLELLETLRALTSKGTSVLLVTHKLNEVMAIADRITVMRDGHVIATVHKNDVTASDLATMMVGREITPSARGARAQTSGEALLAASGLNATAASGRTKLSNVDIHVMSGEIVGIAGVSGNGQELLAEVMSGLALCESGSVTVCGKTTTNAGVRSARSAGLSLIPGNRLGTGLAPGLTIRDNVILTAEKPLVLGKKYGADLAREIISRFQVKARGVATQTKTLSGGNAQKVLMGRELESHAQVYVVVSPTRGLDVGAAEFVDGLLWEKIAEGAGVLLISEDLDEICKLSDRVYVMFDGRIAAHFVGPEFDWRALGSAMAGAYPTPPESGTGQ